MVLSGDVNKRIVNALLLESQQPVSAALIPPFLASKMTMRGQDIGLGKIEQVNTTYIYL